MSDIGKHSPTCWRVLLLCGLLPRGTGLRSVFRGDAAKGTAPPRPPLRVPRLRVLSDCLQIKTVLQIPSCRKSPRRVIARSAATWQSKKALNKSAVADSGSFVPTFRFENLEIHKVFLQFSNLNLEQNPSLTALADLFRASLIRKISYSPENIQEAKLFCEIAPARGTPHP